MAKNLTTHQTECNQAWTTFWRVLKKTHPRVLQELNALTPNYKDLISTNTSPWLSHIGLWCHLEEKHDDEDYLVWQSSRECGAKALELSRELRGWQEKHSLQGLGAFERSLALLDRWSYLSNWQDMPIYSDYGLRPIMHDLPKAPRDMRLISDYLAEVEKVNDAVDYYGPDLTLYPSHKKSKQTRHIIWLVIYLFVGKTYKEIAGSSSREGSYDEQAIGDAIRKLLKLMLIDPRR